MIMFGYTYAEPPSYSIKLLLTREELRSLESKELEGRLLDTEVRWRDNEFYPVTVRMNPELAEEVSVSREGNANKKPRYQIALSRNFIERVAKDKKYNAHAGNGVAYLTMELEGPSTLYHLK